MRTITRITTTLASLPTRSPRFILATWRNTHPSVNA
jgi:hypothetical protein